MKIFSLMQSKLNGKQGIKTPNLFAINDHHNKLQEPPKDEFSDWPHGLLSIGTFGNSNNPTNLKEDQENADNNINIDEQVGEIQKELKLLLDKQEFSAESTSGEEEEELEKCDDFSGENNDNPLQLSNSVVIGRGKDILCDSNNNGKNGIIGKKSVSFLLKKMFLCGSGFTSSPSFRDSLPEPRLDKSRMEKILRAILHKKIYPQSTTPKSSATNAKKYLQNNKDMSICDQREDEMDEKENEGSKWVKTDSDFIVLEI